MRDISADERVKHFGVCFKVQIKIQQHTMFASAAIALAVLGSASAQLFSEEQVSEQILENICLKFYFQL
jgi:hypothetical protein